MWVIFEASGALKSRCFELLVIQEKIFDHVFKYVEPNEVFPAEHIVRCSEEFLSSVFHANKDDYKSRNEHTPKHY